MKRFYSFLKDEGGSATIEFCLWVPLFTFFLMATVDASVLWVTYSQMWNVARDTARRITTRELDTEAQADCYAMWQLGADACSGWGNDWEKNGIDYQKYYVQTTIAGNEARVLIQVNIGNASVFGLWVYGAGLLVDDFMKAQVIMRREPAVIS